MLASYSKPVIALIASTLTSPMKSHWLDLRCPVCEYPANPPRKCSECGLEQTWRTRAFQKWTYLVRVGFIANIGSLLMFTLAFVSVFLPLQSEMEHLSFILWTLGSACILQILFAIALVFQAVPVIRGRMIPLACGLTGIPAFTGGILLQTRLIAVVGLLSMTVTALYTAAACDRILEIVKRQRSVSYEPALSCVAIIFATCLAIWAAHDVFWFFATVVLGLNALLPIRNLQDAHQTLAIAINNMPSESGACE